MKIKETGFAAVNISTNRPYIMVWSIAGYASQVRKNCVENWPDKDGRRATWNDVKRDGYRVRKVKIETI